MTNEEKLAFFNEALRMLDIEIEKTECTLAEMTIQNSISNMENCSTRSMYTTHRLIGLFV